VPVRLLATLVIGIAYLVLTAGRPTSINSGGTWDEALFLRQGLYIATGQWLGPYNSSTLVKGPGYPLFIAASHLTGLSIAVSQTILYFLSSAYLSHVASRVLRSSWLYVTLLLLLLVCPAMYEQSMQRLLREPFYASLVLCYMATLADAAFGKRVPSPVVQDIIKPLVAGLFAGLLWITREEGIWIFPVTAVAFGLGAASGYIPWRVGMHRVAIGAVSATAVCVVVALLNMSHYRVFTLNEIKGSAYQSALASLQRASYLHRRAYMPVPHAARLEIYAQSPTFAKLKPYLDPAVDTTPWRTAGCRIRADWCGDIASGWLYWALRGAAAEVGAHKDARTAEKFYRQLSAEIENACSQELLNCGGWVLPLMPGYMDIHQALTIPSRVATGFKVLTMQTQMSFEAFPSHMEPATREPILALLNEPLYVEPATERRFTIAGWYKGSAREWLIAEGAHQIETKRLRSPDLVAHFADPNLEEQRFLITGLCKPDCSVTFRNDAGATFQIVPDKVAFPSTYTVGDGTLFIDWVRWPAMPTTKAAIYREWSWILAAIQKCSAIFVELGLLAFAFAAIAAMMRRQLSLSLILACTALTAVISRMAILIAADATSMPVLHSHYVAPAVPILFAAVMFSFCAFFDVCGALIKRGLGHRARDEEPSVANHWWR